MTYYRNNCTEGCQKIMGSCKSPVIFHSDKSFLLIVIATDYSVCLFIQSKHILESVILCDFSKGCYLAFTLVKAIETFIYQ